MARPARFTHDGILDEAAEVVALRWRDATVAEVADRLSTPPNSIYYRFPSRHALFGSLWLRSVQRFHVGLLEALTLPDPGRAAEEAAAHIPRFSRQNPLDAIAMTLYRQHDLVELVPSPLSDEVRNVNDTVRTAMVDLAQRRFGRTNTDTLSLVAVACQETGYGLVHRYVRHGITMPPWLDDAVRASCTAILALGD